MIICSSPRMEREREKETLKKTKECVLRDFVFHSLAHLTETKVINKL